MNTGTRTAWTRIPHAWLVLWPPLGVWVAYLFAAVVGFFGTGVSRAVSVLAGLVGLLVLLGWSDLRRRVRTVAASGGVVSFAGPALRSGVLCLLALPVVLLGPVVTGLLFVVPLLVLLSPTVDLDRHRPDCQRASGVADRRWWVVALATAGGLLSAGAVGVGWWSLLSAGGAAPGRVVVLVALALGVVVLLLSLVWTLGGNLLRRGVVLGFAAIVLLLPAQALLGIGPVSALVHGSAVLLAAAAVLHVDD